MAKATWQETGLVLQKLTKVLYAEWGVLLPPPEIPTAPGDDAACDAWCEAIARDPLAEHRPATALRPQLLARLLIAGDHARLLSSLPDSGPGSLRAGLHWLLLDTWHSHGRALWPALCRKLKAPEN